MMLEMRIPTTQARIAMLPGGSLSAWESVFPFLLVSVYFSHRSLQGGWRVKDDGKRHACQWPVSEALCMTPTTSWSTRTSRRWRIPSTNNRALDKVPGWNASLASHPAFRFLLTEPFSDVLCNFSSSGPVSTTFSTTERPSSSRQVLTTLSRFNSFLALSM